MKNKIILFFFFLVQLQAQEKYTTLDFNFPKGVTEVVVKEFEINRVTGDKKLFRTITSTFTNDLIQSRTTAFDAAPIKNEKYSYDGNKLTKYESMDENYIHYETYHYNDKNQLETIKAFDDGVQSNETSFDFNKKGLLVKKTTKEMDGFVSCEEVYTYKSPENYTRKVSFKFATQEGTVDEYIYENGLEVQSKSDSKGATPFITLKTYDRYRNITEINDPITSFINKYDEKGSLIQTNINTNDNLIYTIIEYQYKF